MTKLELKLLAVQIAAQLPADHARARDVIKYLNDLVDNWVYRDSPAVKPSLEVISSSRDARSNGTPDMLSR